MEAIHDMPASGIYIPFSEISCCGLAHWQSDIALTELCDALHISKYYLCHSFKKITGLTVMEYLFQKRIAETKKLLLLSDKSMSSIAEETGFSDCSVFSRAFKRFTGLPPTMYRKQFQRYEGVERT